MPGASGMDVHALLLLAGPWTASQEISEDARERMRRCESYHAGYFVGLDLSLSDGHGNADPNSVLSTIAVAHKTRWASFRVVSLGFDMPHGERHVGLDTVERDCK